MSIRPDRGQPVIEGTLGGYYGQVCLHSQVSHLPVDKVAMFAHTIRVLQDSNPHLECSSARPQ